MTPLCRFALTLAPLLGGMLMTAGAPAAPLDSRTPVPPRPPAASPFGAAGPARSAASSAARPPAPAPSFGRLPLVFEPNRGQVNSPARFLARGKAYHAFLTDRETVLVLRGAGTGAGRPPLDRALRIRLAGARESARPEGRRRLPGTVSYFLGGDESRWRRGLPTFARVVRRGVYPGIDLEYRGDSGDLAYDFRVAPGARPSRIRLRFEGMDRLRLDPGGDALLETPAGHVRHRRPVAYQPIGKRRCPVAARYVRLGPDELGFRLGRYDRRRPLVIDPTLSYATFLGGTGYDSANAIAVGPDGSAYVTGLTTSLNFPTVPPEAGAPGKYGETQNAFVARLNPAGTQLLWAAYLGGGNKDEGRGIALDREGNVWVTGDTESHHEPAAPQFGDNEENPGFPTTANALDPDGHATTGVPDVFIAKIDPGGTRLLYSTYLGFGGKDEGRAVAVDAGGSPIVAGMTTSHPNPDFPDIFQSFPTTPGAYQTAYAGEGLQDGDAFVARLSPDGTRLLYSTYLGGSAGDAANGVAVDAEGNAYVAGHTSSADFPVTPGALQTQFLGGGSVLLGDAFIAKLNPSGTALVYSTFLGGGDTDIVKAIAVDAAGAAYVTGFTDSSELDRVFPVTDGALQPGKSNDRNCPRLWEVYDALGNLVGYEERPGFCNDAFIAKLDPSGGRLLYSTYLGGNRIDTGEGIAVDAQGGITVTGRSDSADLAVRGDTPEVIPGKPEGFVARLDPGGQPVYITRTAARFLSVAVDGSGNAYLAGSAYTDLAATPGAAQTAFGGGGGDAFIARIAGGGSPSAPPLGDMDGSGAADIRDVLLLLRFAAGLGTPTEVQGLAGDLNRDGRLGVQDVLVLLRRVAGLPAG